ncbi:hypothetical protein HJFPF1_07756 [Paramyrothecium foliicola]|nr:hypothetical protein HJFPF1_07756 [Paramyrothecium foliicola]
MDSPHDVAMGEGDAPAHEPFTVEENIHQLNAIDRAIVQLMNHTATALNALTFSPSSKEANPGTEAPSDSLNPEAKKEAFKSATDSFLDALHGIDVRMKRQIFALEEAGIVNLSSVTRQDAASAAPKASLKPNGSGTVGNLDVGWLNSRSTKVERDMEAELWDKARKFLESKGEDVNMD